MPENQCNIEGSSQHTYIPKSTDNPKDAIDGDIDNILTDLFANREGAWGQSSESNGDLAKSCEEAEKENVNPKGVQNVMLGQPQDDERADLNYFYNLQWQGQYYNDPHISPEFGSFLEDANYNEEDQDELDSRGLIEEASVEKSQEVVSSVIQFEPRLTSTTVLPPLSTSEVTSNIQESRTTSIPGDDEEKTAIHEPNQPPSPPQPASPLVEVSKYELRSSSQNRKSEQEDGAAINYLVGKSGGRGGRGRGRGRGGGRGQKRKHDLMPTSVPSPADSVTSVGSEGGQF